MFINKLVYKTILKANFKEKKDRFFICFLRAIQLWLYINFGFLTKLYKKLPNFSIEKKNSHQTFCVFIILVRYHKQSTYVYIMLTFLALSRVCFRDIQLYVILIEKYHHLLQCHLWSHKNKEIFLIFLKEKQRQRYDYLTSTYDFVRHFAMGSRVIIGSIDFKNLWSNKCILRYLMNMVDKIISYIKGLLNFSCPYTLKMNNKKVFVDFKQNTNPWKILLLLVKHKYSH